MRSALDRLFGDVARHERRVRAAAFEQLIVAAALDDLTVVEHDDLVRVANRREPVRDRDRRAALREALELGLDRRLGLRVERARRLVEHQHRRVAQDRPRDRHPLLLSA